MRIVISTFGDYVEGGYPETVVIVRCDTCGREGRYPRVTLAERFGKDATLPDVLMKVSADCGRGGFGLDGRCRRAILIDPATGQPWRR